MAYPLRGPLPHGGDARDVHARRLHARYWTRHRARSSQRLDNVEEFGGGFQVRAGTSAGGADRRHARCPASCPWDPRVRLPGGREPVRVRRSRPDSTPASGRPRKLRRARSRRLVPRAHDVRSGRDARGYSSPREVWDAMAEQPGLAVVDARSCRVATTGASRCCRTSGSAASTSRTARSPRFRSRCATRRPADAAADGHRRPQGRGAARDGRDLHLAADAPARLPADGSADDPLLRARAGCRPGRRRGAAGVGIPRARHGGRVDPEGRRRRRRRSLTFNRSSRASWGSGCSSASPRSA